MVIYGELLFMENLIIGGVLLHITGMIHGKSADTAKAWLRLLVGSFMCGAFSLVIFLDAKVQQLLLMEVVFATAVCMVTFGRSCAENSNRGTDGKSLRRVFRQIPWRCALTFILVTYFMGGITMGLLLVTDNTGIYTVAGIYTGNMKAGFLAVFIWMGYITVIQMIKMIKDKKFYTEHSYEASIVFGNEKFGARAFVDTGNCLEEPLTGRTVAVASDDLWERIQSHEPTDFRFALIPYETVGSKGIMEAIRTDYIEIGGKRIKGCFVAGSDGNFVVGGRRRTGEDYDLLISAEMVNIIKS